MSNATISTNGTCNFNFISSQCTLETCCIALQGHIPYLPSLAGNIAYAAIFAILLVAQLGLGLKYKTWSFLVWMALGLTGEVIGYVGRLMLHSNPFDFNAFLIYLVPLTISPAFMSASVYLSLARLITIYDPHRNCSRLKPMTYTKIFVTFDVISLILQAAGGAIAAVSTNKKGADLGVNVMIAGLAFQVVSLITFMALCADFWWSYRRNKSAVFGLTETATALGKIRNSLALKGFVGALIAATCLILLRSSYRVTELRGGFNGKVAANQTLFMILEGPCIFLACIGLTIFHPGLAVGYAWSTLLKGNSTGTTEGQNLFDKSGTAETYASVNSSDQELQTQVQRSHQAGTNIVG